MTVLTIDGCNVDGDEIGQLFGGLATSIYATDNYDEIFKAICTAALTYVSGCDHASLMIRQGERTITAASSDETASQVDAMERETGTGPCVDAIEDETPHIDADLYHPQLWPVLSERVLQTTSVRGFAGFRVLIDRRKVGALNLFADTAGAFTHRSVNEAAALAAFTSVALAGASARETAATLRNGLHSNREIGKAIGLLMAFHKISDDEAFAMLRRTSQDLNVKVIQVAHEIVAHHNTRK